MPLSAVSRLMSNSSSAASRSWRSVRISRAWTPCDSSLSSTASSRARPTSYPAGSFPSIPPLAPGTKWRVSQKARLPGHGDGKDDGILLARFDSEDHARRFAAGRWTEAERDARIEFIRSCYEDGGRDSSLRNAVIFGQQLLLAALSQGLAGFWIGGVDHEACRREFFIPTRIVIAGVVGLGWPGEVQQPLTRLPSARTVGWGNWPQG